MSTPVECRACTTMGICNCCEGDGWLPDVNTIEIIYDYDGPPYYYLCDENATFYPCPECAGSGRCPDCNGEGEV
jgi:hypothetical protein